MCAATGDRLDITDLHESDPVYIGRGATRRLDSRIIPVDEPGSHRQIGIYEGVGPRLNKGKFAAGKFLCEIDGHFILTQVETTGLRTVFIDQHSAEKVLSGVLLHVVPASSPVDAPLYLRSDLEQLIGHMEDDTDLFEDFEDFGLAESSFIGRLATPLGVEGGLVEDDPPGLLTDLADIEDLCRERIKEGIFPEELPGTGVFSRHIATCREPCQNRNRYVAFSIRVRLVAVG